MKYIIEMSDWKKDERIIKEVEARDVFEAINILFITNALENPNETELIKAEPIL